MAARPVHRRRRRPAQHRKPRPPVNAAVGAAGRLAGRSTVAAATSMAALTSVGEAVVTAPPSSASVPAAGDVTPSISVAVVARHPLVSPGTASVPSVTSDAAVHKAPHVAIAAKRYGAVTRRTSRATARTRSSARTKVTTASPASRVRNSPSRRALLPTFRAQAARQGIPADLLMAVCWMESGWQPRVESSAGAVGVCQIMPQTARFISEQLLNRKPMNSRDPVQNITMSAAYLRYLQKQTGGNQTMTLASYYQGLWRTQNRGLLPETVDYVRDVKALRSQFTSLASGAKEATPVPQKTVQKATLVKQSSAPKATSGSPASRVLASPSRRALLPTFRAQAARRGIRADLLMATCWMESGWQPRVVSSAGAVGVCQIMPDTARFISEVLLDRALMDSRDPVQNITMSAAYLRYLLRQVGGDEDKMLASYYQGLWRTQNRGLLPDTVRYVRVINALQPEFTALASSRSQKR